VCRCSGTLNITFDGADKARDTGKSAAVADAAVGFSTPAVGVGEKMKLETDLGGTEPKDTGEVEAAAGDASMTAAG
jgi:hypothetical protein